MIERDETGQFLTACVNNHYLGFPIEMIQDVIGIQDITNVPMSVGSIAGILNLRGRIVTAIDMRRRFGEDSDITVAEPMGVIIESDEELFSLLVDRVEDVMSVSLANLEKPPATLSPIWSNVCHNVYQVKDRILIIVDPDRILDFSLL